MLAKIIYRKTVEDYVRFDLKNRQVAEENNQANRSWLSKIQRDISQYYGKISEIIFLEIWIKYADFVII